MLLTNSILFLLKYAKKFQNNPFELESWLQDPSNIQEAISLGLINPPPQTPPQTPPKTNDDLNDDTKTSSKKTKTPSTDPS